VIVLSATAMLTDLQRRRFALYKQFKSLEIVALKENVSRGRIHATLEAMSKDSLEYQEFKAIAAQNLHQGRPKLFQDTKERDRLRAQRYRDRKKLKVIDN
jgi:predicted DNA-binding protein YlxM (UPF0122 family)